MNARSTGWLISALMVAATACSSTPAAKYSAKTFVNISPEHGPSFSGTYDFDLLGDLEGSACAEERTEIVNQTRKSEILVDEKREHFRVALANGGEVLGGFSELENRAEAAAIFKALAQVKGAETMLVTRSRVQTSSPTKVCVTVWGKGAQLKKGPTFGGAAATATPVAPVATPSSPTVAPASAAAAPAQP